MGSPIESMIDKATGFDRQAFEAARAKRLADEGAVLLAVADAAKKWHSAPSGENAVTLHRAVEAWVDIGG